MLHRDPDDVASYHSISSYIQLIRYDCKTQVTSVIKIGGNIHFEYILGCASNVVVCLKCIAILSYGVRLMKITRNQCYLLTHIVFFGFYVVDGTGVQRLYNPVPSSRLSG